MLNINASINQNLDKKRKVNFGTNLIVGQGVTEHLNEQPQELKKIQEFKDYLAKDGKNWNAELTYDKFEPKEVSLDETEKLIRKHAQDYDYDARKKAEKNISQMKDSQKAVNFIEKLVKDPNSNVRGGAASLSGHIKDSKLAAELIEKLSKSEDEDVKSFAIISVEYIKDEKLQKSLIQKNIASEDNIVRRHAIELAEKYLDKKETEGFIEKFANDPDPVIRQGAIYSVADLNQEEYNKNPQLYDSIIEKGLSDNDSRVKEVSLYFVGLLSDPKKAAALINEYANGDNDGWIRGKIAESAGYIHDPIMAKRTIEKLLENPDNEVMAGAVDAIRQIEDPKIQKELIKKALNNTDSEIKRELAWSIDNIKDVETVKEVSEILLNDSNSNVRQIAARIMGSITDDNTRNYLFTKYIKSPDLSTRKGITRAVENLANTESDSAQKYAEILAKDEDKYIQKQAKEILNKISEEEKTSHYSIKMSDGDKVLGEKRVVEKEYGEKNLLTAFFNSYKAIFEKNS